MASAFEDAHGEQLQGALTTVDRLIVHGHLSRLWFPNHMAYFLDRLGVHIARDFGQFVKEASSKVIAHAEALARKAGRPFTYQDRVVHGKDDLARQIAVRDGITEGLICVFSTVEPAMCFGLAGGAIRPRLRKCLHLYFYVIDRELGFIHIRLQTWFPFKIQVYLNSRRRGRWMRMNKGLHNLWRHVQIGEATNRRYLDALAEVKPTGAAIAELDTLCRQRVQLGQRFARFSPVSRKDADLFQAVLSGSHLINGLSNKDLQQQLWNAPTSDPAQARRRCQRVCRLIRKLRGHALLAKIPGRRRYRVTPRGRRLLAAALHYRRRDFPAALAA
jgi:hypothetical protein